MPVLFTDSTGLMTGCNTVDNRAPAQDQQQDSKGGGPFASDAGGHAAEPDPQSGCGYASRWPAGGGGFWKIDSGYAGGDFGGTGVGDPGFRGQ